jgi:4-alpha-glucanotransferase
MRSVSRSIGSTSTAASGVSRSRRSALFSKGSDTTQSRPPTRSPPFALAPAPNFLIVEADTAFVLPTKAQRARVTLEDGRQQDLLRDGDALTLSLAEPGYHTLELDDRVVTLAVRPPRCLTPRDLLGRDAWGLTTQIYALRDHGASGDFTGLAAFAEAAGAAGADALAISPTNALFPAAPERCSPYSPSSRDHLNILFADPSVLGAPPPLVTGPDLIDWRGAAAEKLARLTTAHAAFQGDSRFDDFVAAGGEELRRHALFDALDEHFAPTCGAGAWRAWPAGFRDVTRAEAAADLRLNDRVDFYLFAQWLADLGLEQAQGAAKAAGMGLGLIADLAVGLDPGGSHAWRRPDELMMGLTLGAPPDAFQAAGQGWGLTSFAPEALVAANYAPFLATLRVALRHAGGVRIDHALGLGRLWVIPDGAPASQGAYLRYPIDDMLGLIALESRRAGAVIIGEDLGVVPPGSARDPGRPRPAGHACPSLRARRRRSLQATGDLGPARRGHDQHPRPSADGRLVARTRYRLARAAGRAGRSRG